MIDEEVISQEYLERIWDAMRSNQPDDKSTAFSLVRHIEARLRLEARSNLLTERIENDKYRVFYKDAMEAIARARLDQ